MDNDQADSLAAGIAATLIREEAGRREHSEECRNCAAADEPIVAALRRLASALEAGR